MKTRNRIAVAGALACVVLAACTRDPLQGPVAPGTEMVFTATLSEGPGTKTVLRDDGVTVYWTTDEDIKVFFGNSMSGQFHSTNADASLTATFSGSLSGDPGSGTEFWALYPYDPEAACDGSSVTMTLPSAQQGVAGTFADKMFPLLARSSDRNLAFYNVCGGARFSVTEEGITSATFRSVGGEALAGQVKVGMDSDGKPVVQEILDGVSEVTVTAPEGGFVVGQDYFAVLLPGTYGRGISLTLAGGTGSTTWSLAREMTIHRSKFGCLDSVDNGLWDETHKYFTITSQADGNTISFTQLTDENVPTVSGNFWYSLDGGATWTSIGAWEDLASFSHTLNGGETLSLKGDLDKTCFGYQIGIPEAATVSGNIMSLVSGDSFASVTELDAKYAFHSLFDGSLVTDASRLVLPATELRDFCYSNMFFGCRDLTSAPALPATSLAESCYFSMFQNCVNLGSAPVLPATTMAQASYGMMFDGCKKLTTAPELPATVLADHCYFGMFWDCSSLTSAPELSVTELADGCYKLMFFKCSSLTSAPELPATTLAAGCYECMFWNCTNLSYVKAMFTTEPSDEYTPNWLAGVAETGTFVKSTDATWNVVGPNGVPEGWVSGSERVVEVPDDLVYAYRLDENTVHDAFGDRTADYMLPVESPGELLIRDFDRFLMSYMHMDPGQELRFFALDETRTVEGQDYRRALIESPVPYFFLCLLSRDSAEDDFKVDEAIAFHGNDLDEGFTKAEVLLDENGHLMLHLSIVSNAEEYLVCPVTCQEMITRETLSDEVLDNCLNEMVAEMLQNGVSTIDVFTAYYEVDEPNWNFTVLND